MPNWKMRAMAADVWARRQPSTEECRSWDRQRRCAQAAGPYGPTFASPHRERNHEFKISAPTLAEVQQIAGLETRVGFAPPIDQAVRLLTAGGSTSYEGRMLGGGDPDVVGIAEHEIRKVFAEAGGVDAVLNGGEAGEGPHRLLVADCHHNRGLEGGSARVRGAPLVRKSFNSFTRVGIPVVRK